MNPILFLINDNQGKGIKFVLIIIHYHGDTYRIREKNEIIYSNKTIQSTFSITRFKSSSGYSLLSEGPLGKKNGYCTSISSPCLKHPISNMHRDRGIDTHTHTHT